MGERTEEHRYKDTLGLIITLASDAGLITLSLVLMPERYECK